MISDRDRTVLRQFLRYEARQFNWSVLESHHAYRQRMLDEIQAYEGEFEYVTIYSMANLGYKNAALRLTCSPFAFGQSVEVILPSSPLGKLAFHVIPTPKEYK